MPTRIHTPITDIPWPVHTTKPVLTLYKSVGILSTRAFYKFLNKHEDSSRLFRVMGGRVQHAFEHPTASFNYLAHPKLEGFYESEPFHPRSTVLRVVVLQINIKYPATGQTSDARRVPRTSFDALRRTPAKPGPRNIREDPSKRYFLSRIGLHEQVTNRRRTTSIKWANVGRTGKRG